MNIKNCLNKSDVIGSIRLQIRHPSGSGKVWIIVEGLTDKTLFSKLFDGDHAVIEISCGGIISLLQIVAELMKETQRIIGIRDADFLHLEGKTDTPEHIFLTDYHDAEMMIISCNQAYLQVTTEHFGNDTNPRDLRDQILRSIAFIGGIRWINDSDCAELNFEGIGFGNFYDGNMIETDEAKCLNEIMKRSPNRKKDISVQDVRLKILNVSDYLNLCNGHDYLKAYASVISARSNKGVNHEQAGKYFRIAYRFDDFQHTDLYQQLNEWADNQPAAIFKKVSF